MQAIGELVYVRPVSVRLGLVLAVGALLVSCGPDGASGTGPTSTPSIARTEASVAPSTSPRASSVPVLPSAPAVVSAAPPAASASWPKLDAPPPAEEAWATAKAINTAPPEKQATGCTLVHIGEWFRVSCERQGSMDIEGDTGKPDVDFLFKSASSAVVTIRARPGAILGLGLSLPAVHLRIAWPTSAPAPTIAMLDTIDTTELERALPAKEVTDIPAMPPDVHETAPPAAADWLDGIEVNTADTGARKPGCSLRVLGRWLRRTCASSVMLEGLIGLGEKDKDYFNRPNFRRSTLVLRLREGMDVHTSFSGNGPGKMNLEWPTGAPKPTVLDVRNGG